MRRSSITEIKHEIYGEISCSSMYTKTPLGLGRAKRGNENVLAVRLYEHSGFWKNKLGWLTRLTCGELDVKYVGKVTAIPPSETTGIESNKSDEWWHRGRVRPLKIGSSISHGQVTAGTLGCFVTCNKSGEIHLLSNNHVIANQNDAEVGDKICQPGTHDGGSIESDSIATLARFIPIKDSHNLVDAAVADISLLLSSSDRYAYHDSSALYGLGKLNGLYQDEIEPGNIVAKFGRTTGVTLGRITAVEVDRVGVGYGEGPKFFDSQIEVEGAESVAFCQGGDSGSMVVSAPDGRGGKHYALGLLFAGGPRGGSNGKGLTYVNYMSNVLKSLDVKLDY